MNAIKINNLYKEYNLGTIGYDTFSKEITSKFFNFIGKQDPNKKLDYYEPIENGSKILALNNINCEIEKGEVVGIIGPNGSGKSTLLKILSRITTPTNGEIFYNGKISSLLEVGTGFHQELTGRENIYLNGAIYGLSKKEIDQRIDEIIKFSGCLKYIDTPVKRYSSGMYVRLGFSVAAHLEPDILVVDEVLAVGDEAFRNKAVEKINDLNKKINKTVLFVSHNMDAIRNLCSRCILLKSGKIEYDGDVNTAIQKYLYSTQTANLDEYTFLNDKKLRRGNGKARISKIKFLNSKAAQSSNFDIGEEIEIKFSIKTFDIIYKPRILFIFKSIKSNENIFSREIELCKEIKADLEKSFCLIIKTPNVNTNTFNIFIEIKEDFVKGQIDTLDNILPPINIEHNTINKHKSLFDLNMKLKNE